MIFIDRSIPKGVANALKAVREDVRWLEDEFPHNTKDEDWLAEVGAREWIVITRDKRIKNRPGLKEALIRNEVGAFCLSQVNNPTRWELLKLLTQTIDEMERLFEQTTRPFVYSVDRYGGFNRLI